MNQTDQMHQADQPPAQSPAQYELLDMLIVVARRWRLVVALTCATLVAGAVLAFVVIKPTFLAAVTILPPQTPQSSAASMAGQLGPLAALAGVDNLLGNPAFMYVGVLESQTIADHLIARFHLQQVWNCKTLEDTRVELTKRTQIEATKIGMIQITVIDHDASRASDLANAFIDELNRRDATLATAAADERRIFLEQEFNQEKIALAAAEEALKSTEEKTGLVDAGGQAAMAIRSIAQTQAKITSTQAELAATRSYATDQNSDVIRLQAEIAALRRQLVAMERDSRDGAKGNVEVASRDLSERGLESIRAVRDAKYHQELFALLSKQLAAARMDEARSAPDVQVIDRAVPSDRKAGPSRLLLTLGFGMAGACTACLWIFLGEGFMVMRLNPVSARGFRELRTTLRPHRS